MFLIIFSSLIVDLQYSRTTYDFAAGLTAPSMDTQLKKARVEFLHTDDDFEYYLEEEGGLSTKLVCPKEHYEFFINSGSLHESCKVYSLNGEEELPIDSGFEYEQASFPFNLLKLSDFKSTKENEESVFLHGINFSEISDDGIWHTSLKGEVITSSQGFPMIGARVFSRINKPVNVLQEVLVTIEDSENLVFSDSIYMNPILEIETNYGNYFVELFFDRAPETSQNFLELSRRGFFDGTICHRIILGFVNQCGDLTGTGWGGPGYEFDNEVHPDLKHAPYVLSMANAGPDTNGSQWFIPIKDTERVRKLDGNYSIFGEVISGFEVVDLINSVKVNNEDNHRPIKPVIIKQVSEIFPWLGSSLDLGHKASPVDFLDSFLIDGEVQIAQIGNVDLEDIEVEVQKELYGNSFEISGFVVLKIIVGENITNHYFLIDESGDLVMAIDLMGNRYESAGLYEDGIWNFSFDDLGFNWQIWMVPEKEMYFSVKDSNNVFSWGMVRYVNE